MRPVVVSETSRTKPRPSISGARPGRGSIPYLDGLRAYSILIVLLNHSIEYGHATRLLPWLGTRWAAPFRIVFADGDLGVRVFFVLSGFLITSMLLDELDASGSISIIGFYGRRIARIFPAAYCYILALILLAALHWMSLPWKPVVAAATYTWNYTNLGGSPSGAVLGHFWTLSLEEQFYLVWPSFLLFAGKRWAKRISILCLGIFPFLRIAFYFLAPGHRGLIVGMFHTGADQILWGAVGAFAYKEGALEWFRSWKFRRVLPWACLFAVFVIAPLATWIFRGLNLVMNISIIGCSVMLMIFWLLSGDGGLARKILSCRPIIQLGLLSYSIYIWQQIFLVWPGTERIPFPLNLGAAILAGFLSFRLIEVPLRSKIRRWFSQPPPGH